LEDRVVLDQVGEREAVWLAALLELGLRGGELGRVAPALEVLREGPGAGRDRALGGRAGVEEDPLLNRVAVDPGRDRLAQRFVVEGGLRRVQLDPLVADAGDLRDLQVRSGAGGGGV